MSKVQSVIECVNCSGRVFELRVSFDGCPPDDIPKEYEHSVDLICDNCGRCLELGRSRNFNPFIISDVVGR